MTIDTNPIARSFVRLVQAVREYRKNPSPYWRAFLKKESSILLRRVFKFWWLLRFGKNKNKGGEKHGLEN
jgi:hypothetical protein